MVCQCSRLLSASYIYTSKICVNYRIVIIKNLRSKFTIDCFNLFLPLVSSDLTVIQLLSTSIVLTPKKKTPNQNAISNKYSVLIGRWWGTSYKLILASVMPVRPSLLFLVLDSLSRRRIGLFIIEDLLVTVQERTTGDLSRCWLSYVGLLVYCPHKLRLFYYFERTW
jgi:hypothetical protein